MARMPMPGMQQRNQLYGSLSLKDLYVRKTIEESYIGLLLQAEGQCLYILMYAFTPGQTLCLVYEDFYLAISDISK